MDFTGVAEKLQTDGFAIIENFLTSNEITALKDRMFQIIDGIDPTEHKVTFVSTRENQDQATQNDYFTKSGDRISFFFEEGALDKEGKLQVDKQVSVNKVGHGLHCRDPVFAKITQSHKVKSLVKALGQVDPVICQSMYIFKQPKIGGEVRPHYDSTFIITNPKTLVGLWIPLDDATKENGCLWFIPGSHKNDVKTDFQLVRNPDYPAKEGAPAFIYNNTRPVYDESGFVPAEMKAGSLALIDGAAVHKSEHNYSEKSRHAYIFHVFDSYESEYSKENWLQPTEKGNFVHLFASGVLKDT